MAAANQLRRQYHGNAATLHFLPGTWGSSLGCSAATTRRPRGEQIRRANGDQHRQLMAALGQAFGTAMGSTALQDAWGPLVSKAAAVGALTDKGHMFITPCL